MKPCSFFVDPHVEPSPYLGCQAHNTLPENCAVDWHRRAATLSQAIRDFVTWAGNTAPRGITAAEFNQAVGTLAAANDRVVEETYRPSARPEPTDGEHFPGGDA